MGPGTRPDQTTLREAEPGGAEAISALVTALAPLFLADPGDLEAAGPFLATVSPGAFRGYLASGRFTVNSSRYAIPVYERFGFRATGPEVHKDGVTFVPMALDEHGASSRGVRRAGDRRP